MIVSDTDHSMVETVLEERDRNEGMQVRAVKECVCKEINIRVHVFK
jgi:hypothetical protein